MSPMGTSAASLHREAVDLANQGRLATAERALARAAGLTDDADLSARILGTLAVIRARTGDVGEAERLCLEAMDGTGLSRETVAILEGQMGAIAEFAGRLDDATLWLGRAIAMTDEPVARANMLVNRGLIGMQRRDLDAAADDTAAAAGIFAAADRAIDAAEARHNLGYIDLLRGDIVAALSEMTAARAIIAGVSKANAAIGDLDRATVLRDAGLTREAEALLASAAKTFGDTRMPRERAEAEFQLARSLLTHDPRRARRIARTAVRRFEALGNPTWTARAEALEMRAELAGGQMMRGGTRVPPSRHVPDTAAVDRVAGELESRGLRTESAALRLARQLWEARRGRAAGRRVSIPSTATMDVRLLQYEVVAARAAVRGRHADARRHAASGLDALFEWQRDFGSLDLQTSLMMHANGLIGLGLESAARSGRPDVVFDWSERTRHLSFQVAPLRPPPDETLADDLAELRMLRAEHADGEWRAAARVEELQSRARERQWSSMRSSAVLGRVSLAEAQSGLGDDAAIVAYVYTGEGLAAVVATADSAQLMHLDGWDGVRGLMSGLRADLDMAASIPATSPLRQVVRRSLDGRLAALSRALVEPVLPAVGSRRVVITTPVILNGIPWAMLPGLRGHPFTLAASVSRWHSLRATAGRAPSSAGFVIGPRVPRAAEETGRAAGSWATAVTLPHADIAGTTALASQVDVLHIASHGRHSAENPMFSGLELADGTLFGYDIDLIEKVPETVILSACEVGRSSVRWGEEAVGMTRIWLHAGARCVVAAPVVVADDDACELLGAMHEGLAAGLAPSDALAAAATQTGIVAPFQVHGAGF
ncbi:CHAT domain protein [Microbacterium terrae]|uniref:CHAT domain protein n=2 Tax=Microbacterium terrae TaxID=69369 RepID=A0A0M2HLF3_9MICO|nr:CHAT domain protein [Microbacterium terrae]